MKQIKTIRNRLDNADNFDDAVNAALKDGWQLTKREVLLPMAQSEALQMYTTLYAELEREIITEEERCCENCAHYDTVSHNPPCCDCSSDADKWEPAT